MPAKITKRNDGEYLETGEEIAAHLNAIAEENDPALLQAALGDIARTRGMTSISRKAGVSRESLYKSLSTKGNPSFQTIFKVSRVLGVKITFEPLK